jgi:hypothetical protein
MLVAPAPSTAGLVIHGFLLSLYTIAFPTVMHAMTHVADVYEECADSLLRDFRLINCSEEAFPGNGLAFLQMLQQDHAVSIGLKLHRMPINGQMMLTSLVSLVAALLLTVVLNTVKGVE